MVLLQTPSIKAACRNRALLSAAPIDGSGRRRMPITPVVNDAEGASLRRAWVEGHRAVSGSIMSREFPPQTLPRKLPRSVLPSA